MRVTCDSSFESYVFFTKTHHYRRPLLTPRAVWITFMMNGCFKINAWYHSIV